MKDILIKRKQVDKRLNPIFDNKNIAYRENFKLFCLFVSFICWPVIFEHREHHKFNKVGKSPQKVQKSSKTVWEVFKYCVSEVSKF